MYPPTAGFGTMIRHTFAHEASKMGVGGIEPILGQFLLQPDQTGCHAKRTRTVARWEFAHFDLVRVK